MKTRSPSAAGRFYPQDADLLSELLANFLLHADQSPVIPKALIVPHAGYQYSGAVAAEAYRCLQNVAAAIKRVVIIGPVNKCPIEGGAVPDNEFFATPLGDVPTDTELCERLCHLPFMIKSDRVHAGESSLEVQLPFLQLCLLRFSVVPILVGYIDEEDMCTLLDECWGGPETLIVISSDLSHHQDYEKAQMLDIATCANIMEEQGKLSLEQSSGAFILNGFLRYCRKKQLAMDLMAVNNSGNITGEKDIVDGYASFAAH